MTYLQRRLLAVGMSITLLATLGLGVAFATLAGSTFESGDGNLVVDTAGNKDWASAVKPGFHSANDLATGSADNSLGQGTKENSVNITVVDGSIPNSKADIGRFAVASETIGTDTYLYLAWTRNNLSGTTNFDFEINQVAQPDLTTQGAKTLNRTTGDLLITYDFNGGSQRPELGARRWLASNEWGPNIALGANSSEAEVNRTGAVSDVLTSPAISRPAFAFGEAGINLTAAGLMPAQGGGGACAGFASIYVKSRSSDAFSAALKDFIAPIPVDINNCGTVTIIKHTAPAGLDQNFGFTSTLTGTGDPDTTPAAFTLNDGGVDTEVVTNVPIGSYTITEGANPSGFTFDSVSCVVTGSATQSTAAKVATVGIVAGGDTVTCTYLNNQNLGAIKISKTDSKTDAALAGATFSVTGPGSYSSAPVTGADGSVCVDGLVFGTYAVTETAAPAGYKIDDTTSHNVVVDTNTSCAADPYDGEVFSATDTPLSRIQVRFDDQGSGVTTAVITCDNTTGTDDTTDTTNWDETLTVTDIEAPTLITCTIDIDP